MKLGVRMSNALILLIYLSKEDRKVSSTELANYLGTTKNAILKVSRRLSDADLIEAFNGVKGGYQLRKPLNEISLLDVKRAIEDVTVKTELFNDNVRYFVDHSHDKMVKELNKITIDKFENDIK